MSNNEDKGERPDKRLLPASVQNIEWLKLCCYSILFYISGVYVPIVGIVIALASPVPISLIGIRQGINKAFLAVAFVAAFLLIVFGEVGSVSYVFGAGLLGVVFVIIVKKTNSAGEAIFGLIIAAVAAKLLFMGYMVYTRGANPFVLDEDSINSLIRSFYASGASDDILETVKQHINLSIPSFLIMAAGFDAFVSYLLVSKIEHRRLELLNTSETETNELKVLPMPPFEQWSFPRSLLVAFFSALLISLFNDSNTSIMLISAEINLKILTSIMFYIQGLSFVWWWLNHKNFSYGIRLSVFFVLLFIPIFFMGLIILGIVDITVNLREKIRRLSNK